MKENNHELTQPIIPLINKYLRKTLTTREADQLNKWLDQCEENRSLFWSLTTSSVLRVALHDVYRIDRPAALNKLLEKIKPQTAE
jgi:hypothetical protein